MAERIAELEATAVRKGNQKVELKITGVVNRALLFWDDGAERNVYGVDSPQDGTAIALEGEVEIGKGWKAGYLAGYARVLLHARSVRRQQRWKGGGRSYWWIGHDRYGTVRLG